MHQNNENAIKIIKLVNGDDIVCILPKEQLGEKSPLIRLDRPLQIKYVPQLTPSGFRDYIALIKWTGYSKDRIITIPKDKILAITNAGDSMITSYFHIVKDYDKENLKTMDASDKYKKQKLTDDENKKINEIFDDFCELEDEDTTIH
jgi:hypothetical protein